MSHSESIELAVERLIAHKRALGRKYVSEQRELRLLVRFAAEHGAVCLDDLTPALLDGFLASRPRQRPRSFNHLLGVVGCLLDWAVSQQLLTLSPLRTRRRRVTSTRIPFLFDPVQARRLLDAAGALPDNPRALQRGVTYRTLFALCYGLGLRAGEACGLRIGDVNTARDLLVVKGGKFGKSRLVPHGPRIAELVADQLDADTTAAPAAARSRCSRSTARSLCIPAPPARRSTGSCSRSSCRCPTGSHHRRCIACVTASLSGVCCVGIARGWTQRPDCISSRRSWVTSRRPRPPST